MILLLPAVVLLILGVLGLSTADRDSLTDFVLAGLALAAGIALTGIAVVARKLGEPEPAPRVPHGSDRAEVIERLYRHTEAFRETENVLEPQPVSLVHYTTGTDVRSAPETTMPRLEATAVRLRPVLLLNLSRNASLADIESAPPLGTRQDVLARLREVVPDLEIDPKGRSEHAGPDHSVRLDLGSCDLVHTMVIEASGGTGVSLVRWILESTGWRAFVPKSGRFVEPDALDSIAVREDL